MAYKSPDEEFEEQLRDAKDNFLDRDPLERHAITQEACEAHQREVDEFLGRSADDPFGGCNPGDARVLDSERDARLRYGDRYDTLVDQFIIPHLRESPKLFLEIRNSHDPAEFCYQLARCMQNPKLLARPEFAGFEEYARGLSERRTGKFDNLSPEAFARVLDAYREHAEEGESIEEFFTR
jgi:hypothetical protein